MKKVLLPVFILALTVCTANPGMQYKFRKKITIDHTNVFNVNQKDFPVLVSVTDPVLKSASYGGHVSNSDGDDIFFTLPDGKTMT